MDSSRTNTSKRRRLIASANDPAAAYQLSPILRALKDQRVLELKLFATGPAFHIFKRNGLNPVAFMSKRVAILDLEASNFLLESARVIYREAQPDGLLVGLSGPDCGVDEALLACATEIPTFAIQDFWGDVNYGFGVLPQTYFVLDELAATLTATRAPNSRIVISGSPKHNKINSPSTNALRKCYRHRIPIGSVENVIVFIGQPLWHLPGYRRTLQAIAHSLAALYPTATITYRFHPRENSEYWLDIKECFSEAGLIISKDVGLSLEETICGADLLLTCFSNAGLDLSYLNSLSLEPLAPMIYLLIDYEIRNYFKTVAELERIPLATLGMAIEVRSGFDFSEALVKCMTHLQRGLFQKKSQEYFRGKQDAVVTVTNSIYNLIN